MRLSNHLNFFLASGLTSKWPQYSGQRVTWGFLVTSTLFPLWFDLNDDFRTLASVWPEAVWTSLILCGLLFDLSDDLGTCSSMWCETFWTSLTLFDLWFFIYLSDNLSTRFWGFLNIATFWPLDWPQWCPYFMINSTSSSPFIDLSDDLSTRD